MKNLGIALLVGLLAGAAITRMYWPAVRVETKQIDTVRTDVVTVEKVVVRPDGTTESTKTTTDKSVQNRIKSQIKTESKEKYLLGATARTNFDGKSPIYGLAVHSRILGPIFLGAGVDTSKQVSLSLLYAF
jgi:type IV secretory pathway protease TraF